MIRFHEGNQGWEIQEPANLWLAARSSGRHIYGMPAMNLILELNLKYVQNLKARNADPLPGPTGVETAGELGFEYGKNKEITLVKRPSSHKLIH